MSVKPSTLANAAAMTSLNADAVPRCTTHRKRLKFFCSIHELLLCSVCAVKRHRGCEEILTITEACEDKRAEGRKILETHAQRVALLENAMVERKAAKKLLETNVQEIENEIHEMTEKIIDLVKHEERNLLEAVQTMQTREADTLDRDIVGLEETCNQVRTVHETLAQSLKFSEVDLIYAVIKEKHQQKDENDVDAIVKKRFREVDFKFIVSPHVSSFLRHFKSLGQVMLSDESGNQRVPRSAMSTPVNDPPAFIPVSRSHGDTGSSSTLLTEESATSTRDRWNRDRQKHMQAQIQDHNNDDSVFTFDIPAQNLSQSRERRSRPMRALPRPETPEVYSRQQGQTQRRDFVARPVSTPPDEHFMLSPSPKSRDVDRFNTIAPFRGTRPSDYLPTRDRRSPVPIRSPPGSYPAKQDTLHHSEPAHVFQQRRTPTETPASPLERSLSSLSPTRNGAAHAYPVYIKESDFNYGRSFAAVQVNEVTKPPRMASPQTSPGREDGRYGQRSGGQNGLSNGPVTGRSFNDSQYGFNDSQALNETGSFTPSTLTTNVVSQEIKQGRWIEATSFTSHGMGSKRLISGLGFLPDGRAIVVDQEHYTVQLYDPHFRFLTELKLESRPFDAIVLSENKIVVSLQSERVLKFLLLTSEGFTIMADLGVPCDMVCYGLAHGGGNYAVCCGDEVWVLSEEGRVVTCLKKDKAGNNMFVQAEYVEMDRAGTTLFVSDIGSQKLLAVQIDGRRLWEFSYQGFKPAGLKLFEQYLFVCDRDQHRVLTLNTLGNVVKQSVIGRLENPRALCLNATGNQMMVSQMRYDAVVSPPRPIHVFTFQ